MKRKSNWLKVFNSILSSLLTLLGYTSCDSSEDIPVEYGTPYAKYEVKGKVVDKESLATIEGARVIVKPVISNDGAEQTSPYYNDTVYTDKDGKYIYQKEVEAYDYLRVVCEDPSGTYEADSTLLKMNPENGQGWYQGSDSQTADFELDKKEL